MSWCALTSQYDQLTLAHDCRLSSLPEVWQRELAALWRLESDVNNGAYIQFLVNRGHESYAYASQALKRIGAVKMAQIIDRCQALVDEHFDTTNKTPEELNQLMPNELIGMDGKQLKPAGSVLPEHVVKRVYELSYEFMKYPEDIAQLGLRFYQSHFDKDKSVSGDASQQTSITALPPAATQRTAEHVSETSNDGQKKQGFFSKDTARIACGMAMAYGGYTMFTRLNDGPMVTAFRICLVIGGLIGSLILSPPFSKRRVSTQYASPRNISLSAVRPTWMGNPRANNRRLLIILFVFACVGVGIALMVMKR